MTCPFTSNPKRSSLRQDKLSILPRTRMVVEMWLWMNPLGAAVTVFSTSGSHVIDAQGCGIPQLTEHLGRVQINLEHNFRFILVLEREE